MGIRTWILAAVAVVVTSCATSPIGNGTGRYLVLRDYGIAYIQVDAITPEGCAQVRNQAKTMATSGTGKADCESVDQSENLPYVISAAEGVRVSTLTRSLCTALLNNFSPTNAKETQDKDCSVASGSLKGRRFFQVRDNLGKVYGQMDLATEANCEQFKKAQSTPQGNVRHFCTQDSRSSEMHYTARIVMSSNNMPAYEIDVVDKFFCEAVTSASSAQGSGYRTECVFKR